MKAHELAKQLLAGPDVEVIIQKDGEGNGYSPLEGQDTDSVYVADSTWSGEVYSTDWSADDACMQPEEWERFKADNPRVVVLYPVN